MPRLPRGSTPGGFRTQLLRRPANAALAGQIAPGRLQQQIACERLLARLPADGSWALKGGFALQFRYGTHTRSTRDVDLRVVGEPYDALRTLRNAIASSPVEDRFAFELSDVAHELQGAPGGTLRVRIVALVGDEELATFHLDISAGDALIGAPEYVFGSNLLEFAGIAAVRFPIYPVVQHLAEKLHAYTLPRHQENTRVKDLVDLAVFAATERVKADRLRASVEATFTVRASHQLPLTLPAPPAAWAQPYAKIAAEAMNPVLAEMLAGYVLAAAFWNPFLAHMTAGHVWLPASRQWRKPPA